MAHQDGGAGRESGPEPAQGSKAAPQVESGGCEIAIHRTGPAVEITLTFNGEYASIELYDSLVRSASKGTLRLDLKLPRP